MLARILPPEVCAHIVHYTRLVDLPALCLTSKAFKTAAEYKLYRNVIARDSMTAWTVCGAIVAHNGLRGPLVRRLWIYQDPRIAPQAALPKQFWELVRDALRVMINLEDLFLFDASCSNSWVLDPGLLRFQLLEASLSLPWDQTLLSFLKSQKQLRALAVQCPSEGEEPLGPLEAGDLLGLEAFDGPLLIAAELLSCSLKCIQVAVDDENAPLFSVFLSNLVISPANQTLLSLNVVSMPEHLVADSLGVLASSPLASRLRHLGILTLPWKERHQIHEELQKFSRLQTLQVDVGHWEPKPMHPHQKMIATELRIYCPTIRSLSFWLPGHLFVWRCDGEQWAHVNAQGRQPAMDTTWRSFII